MISLINFQDHPTNRNKKVFFFRNELHAAHFESLLQEQNVAYEKQIDTEGDHRIYYGVKIGDFEKTKTLNYLTIGKFRKKFIPDTFFRYFLILLSILVVSLGIVGYFISN